MKSRNILIFCILDGKSMDWIGARVLGPELRDTHLVSCCRTEPQTRDHLLLWVHQEEAPIELKNGMSIIRFYPGIKLLSRYVGALLPIIIAIMGPTVRGIELESDKLQHVLSGSGGEALGFINEKLGPN